MHKLYLLLSAIFIYVIITGSGCDNTVSPPAAHFEAEGMMLLTEDGDTVMYYFQGLLNQGFDTLTVPYGAISEHLSTYFLDSNRNKLNPPSGEYSLGHTIQNPSMLSVFTDDPNDTWQFHLRGHEVGYTNITFRLMHTNHSDFNTIPVPVHIDTNVIGEAIGIRITYEKSGEVIFNYTGSGTQTGAGLIVGVGNTTDHAVVQFYDKKGNLFTPPYPNYDLQGDVIPVSGNIIANFINEAPDEPFVFRILGNSPGTSKIVFSIKQGSKLIYNSPGVNVVVN